MSDYISRQAAIVRVIRLIEDDEETYDCKEALKDIPAADVVEVVRCKDCKHIKEEHFNIMPDGYSCELSGLMVEPEHYCSYGERAGT